MYPSTVKLCNKECFRMLSVDAGAGDEESIKDLIYAFLAVDHDTDMHRLEPLVALLHKTQELAGWELCSCDSHVCSLAIGPDCMSGAIEHHLWDINQAELSTVDHDHIYLKLPMD